MDANRGTNPHYPSRTGTRMWSEPAGGSSVGLPKTTDVSMSGAVASGGSGAAVGAAASGGGPVDRPLSFWLDAYVPLLRQTVTYELVLPALRDRGLLTSANLDFIESIASAGLDPPEVMDIVLTNVGERPIDLLYDLLIVLRDAADGSYADLIPQLVPELTPNIPNFGGQARGISDSAIREYVNQLVLQLEHPAGGYTPSSAPDLGPSISIDQFHQRKSNAPHIVSEARRVEGSFERLQVNNFPLDSGHVSAVPPTVVPPREPQAPQSFQSSLVSQHARLPGTLDSVQSPQQRAATGSDSGRRSFGPSARTPEQPRSTGTAIPVAAVHQQHQSFGAREQSGAPDSGNFGAPSLDSARVLSSMDSQPASGAPVGGRAPLADSFGSGRGDWSRSQEGLQANNSSSLQSSFQHVSDAEPSLPGDLDFDDHVDDDAEMAPNAPMEEMQRASLPVTAGHATRLAADASSSSHFTAAAHLSLQPQMTSAPPPLAGARQPMRMSGAAKAPLELFEYQEELAGPALAGQNSIICAPTGSGKTIVAAKIAAEHLARPPAGRVPRIAFLVHTRQLVQQQSAQFKRYLACRVVEIVGQASGEGGAVPLRSQLSDEPVMFVMIASLLVNALQPGPDAVKSICEFSLIFIDECHHTKDEHPFNKVMEYYVGEKQSQSRPASLRLPQIVGLTASPGTGQAKNLLQAREHILRLCANLDARRFVTVRDNLLQLRQVEAKPQDEVLSFRDREPDNFAEIISENMREIEKDLKTLLAGAGKRDLLGGATRSGLLSPQPRDDYALLVEAIDRAETIRGTQEYINFLGNALRQQVPRLVLNAELKRDLVMRLEFLQIYNKSLHVNEVARHMDALNFLCRALRIELPSTNLRGLTDLTEEDVEELDSDSDDPIISSSHEYLNGSDYIKKLLEQLDQLQQISAVELSLLESVKASTLDSQLSPLMNRKLCALKRTIMQQFTADASTPAASGAAAAPGSGPNCGPNSRVLVFVTQRVFGLALVQVLLDDKELKQAVGGVGLFTGSNARAELGGSTQAQQDALIAEFRSGSKKVLVCTTVAEEGVDVQECNLVIRYCIVTNEIAMVQSKGRGRAKHSKYLLIVGDNKNYGWMASKERVNEMRNTLMQEAVEAIAQMEPNEYDAQIQRFQQAMLVSLAAKKRAQQQRAAAANNGAADKYELRCGSCDKLVARQSEIRVIENSHHVIICPDLLERVTSRQGTLQQFQTIAFNGSLLCKQCGYELGTTCQYSSLHWAVIKVASLTVVNVSNPSERSRKKKWRDVPFEVAQLALDDITRYSTLDFSRSVGVIQ